MADVIKKTPIRNSEIATRVKRTAEICGTSSRQVYRVIVGDQINENIMSVFMQFQEAEALLIKAITKRYKLKANS